MAEFTKGSKNLYFETSYSEGEFKICEFLKKNFSTEFPQNHLQQNRGILTAKKAKIERELCQYMHPRKQLFWKQLATDDNAQDLCFKSAD